MAVTSYAIALVATFAAFATPLAAQSTFSNASPFTVPASGSGPAAASPYPSTITVSGLPGTVTKVTATVSGINHTFSDDLDIMLVGPNGARLRLMSDRGGSDNLFDVSYTFDDAAVQGLQNNTARPSGTWQPMNFNGNDVNADPLPAPAPATPAFSAASRCSTESTRMAPGVSTSLTMRRGTAARSPADGASRSRPVFPSPR